MLYSRDLAAVLPIMPEFCRSFAAQRQDHGRGVLWWDSGFGAGIRRIWACMSCEMVVFVGFGGLVGSGI